VRAQNSRAQRDGHAALPSEADLPGYQGFAAHERELGAMLEATRKSDQMAVRVAIYIGTNAAAARRVANPSGGLGQVPMTASSRSGRKIGDEVLHTARYHSGGPPRGAFTMVSRVGCAVVTIQLMHRITRGNGKPVHPVFSESDLRWAEDVAIGCVERLKRMGYGDEAEKKAQSKTKGGQKTKGK